MAKPGVIGREREHLNGLLRKPVERDCNELFVGAVLNPRPLGYEGKVGLLQEAIHTGARSTTLPQGSRWKGGCRENQPALARKFVISRDGGAPNDRLYSRLNWEGLS